MLKLIAAIFLSIAMLIGIYPHEKIVDANDTNYANYANAATCYGYTPCNACSNCSKCKYCSNGGTCGKCTKPKETYKSETPAPIATQCKAITKKGTRCKRAAGSNGYCWQHG